MKECKTKGYTNINVIDLKDYDPEDNLLNEVNKKFNNNIYLEETCFLFFFIIM
jgi:hypothetical protein